MDFLQDWSRKKKVERAFKIYVTRKDPEGLSVMHPRHYKERFQTCMDQIFESSAGSSDSKLSSRNTSTQNLANLGMPLPTTHLRPQAVVVVDEVLNPLQSQPSSTPKKAKKVAAAKPETVVAAVPPVPSAQQANDPAVNNTALLDESVDEFADFLDSTAVMEPKNEDSDVDML